jgi:hypothetical protein
MQRLPKCELSSVAPWYRHKKLLTQEAAAAAVLQLQQQRVANFSGELVVELVSICGSGVSVKLVLVAERMLAASDQKTIVSKSNGFLTASRKPIWKQAVVLLQQLSCKEHDVMRIIINKKDPRQAGIIIMISCSSWRSCFFSRKAVEQKKQLLTRGGSAAAAAAM